MTVYEIMVLCHMHVFGDDWPYAHGQSYHHAVAKFVNYGLITRDTTCGSGYRTTELGNHVVECLKGVRII